MSEPVGWIGYQDDRLVSFLQNLQQVNQFLDATNPTGQVIPLYTSPQKYCPSENNEAYEKGFIDGMAKQRDSAVQRFVESGTPDSELAEHKRIIREQQAEIEALKSDTIPYRDLHQVVKNVLAQPMRELSDEEIATMLRQQQTEIEKLGSELDRIVELYTDKAIENEALKKELALKVSI